MESDHVPSDPEDSSICQEPRCSKRAHPSKPHRIRQYCKLHMRQHGMQPVDADQYCQFGGCEKIVVTSKDGCRMYCVAHMREMGHEPNFKYCQQEGCHKKAQPSTDGSRSYCNGHMHEHGLVAQVNKAQQCRQPGCSKTTQLDSAGFRRYCIKHMKENGLKAKVNMCRDEGCTKMAYPSTCRQRIYCVGHMRAYGLAPLVKRCKVEGCGKRAVTSEKGGPRRFCAEHLREQGFDVKRKGDTLPRKRGPKPRPIVQSSHCLKAAESAESPAALVTRDAACSNGNRAGGGSRQQEMCLSGSFQNLLPAAPSVDWRGVDAERLGVGPLGNQLGGAPSLEQTTAEAPQTAHARVLGYHTGGAPVLVQGTAEGMAADAGSASVSFQAGGQTPPTTWCIQARTKYTQFLQTSGSD